MTTPRPGHPRSERPPPTSDPSPAAEGTGGAMTRSAEQMRTVEPLGCPPGAWTGDRFEFVFGNADVFRRFTLYTWGSTVLVLAIVEIAHEIKLTLDPSVATGVRTALVALVSVIARICWLRLHDLYRTRKERRSQHRQRRKSKPGDDRARAGD